MTTVTSSALFEEPTLAALGQASVQAFRTLFMTVLHDKGASDQIAAMCAVAAHHGIELHLQQGWLKDMVRATEDARNGLSIFSVTLKHYTDTASAEIHDIALRSSWAAAAVTLHPQMFRHPPNSRHWSAIAQHADNHGDESAVNVLKALDNIAWPGGAANDDLRWAASAVKLWELERARPFFQALIDWRGRDWLDPTAGRGLASALLETNGTALGMARACEQAIWLIKTLDMDAVRFRDGRSPLEMLAANGAAYLAAYLTEFPQAASDAGRVAALCPRDSEEAAVLQAAQAQHCLTQDRFPSVAPL